MMKPFFENKRVRLFCGNSLDVLQELKANNEHFDLMLTDPPYGLNQKNNKPSGINAKRAKASYKDDMFDDTFDYLKETVRPIFDLSMSICNLGIITAGVGCYKYLPPPTKKDVCICLLLRHLTHGHIQTFNLYGIMENLKAIMGSIVVCLSLLRNKGFLKTIHVRNHLRFGRSSCYAARTARKTRRYSTHSAVVELLEELRKTYV